MKENTAKPVPSVESFVERLTASGLMTAAEIEGFLVGLPADYRPRTAEELARELLRRGVLTKFQAQAVYQGKTRGLVLGNYVVLDRLGEGGMGQIYKAQHRKMKRVVALKMLPSAATKSPDAIKRFQREVEAAAKLRHSNIVRAHDAGEARGVHFLVMEYVDGKDLSATVKLQGSLAVALAVDYIAQAAKGLEYAHNQGVIHRDIKPSNLLLDRSGVVKILDMGLARVESLVGQTDEGLTRGGQVMGTLDYMAPEQALDTKYADARSDVYSLGCTLYYLLAGRAPFAGDTATKKILAHREQPVPSLRTTREDVPESLDAVFRKMLAKQPEDRQQSMTEVLAELQGCKLPATAPVAASARTAGPPPMPAVSETLSLHQEQVGTSSEQVDVRSRIERSAARHSTVTFRRVKPWAANLLGSLSKRPRIMAAVATGVLFLFLLLGVILTLRTREGTLVVELSDPDVTVQIISAEGKVQIERQGGQDKIEIGLDPGNHRLRVQKGGLEVFAQDFTIASGGKKIIKATWKQPSATYQVDVDPSHATLTAEGKQVSVAGQGLHRSITVIEPDGRGKILVKLAYPGYEPLTQELQPQAGESRRLTLRLKVLPVSAPAPSSQAVVENEYSIVPPDLSSPEWKKELEDFKSEISRDRNWRNSHSKTFLLLRIRGEPPTGAAESFGISRGKNVSSLGIWNTGYTGLVTGIRQGEFLPLVVASGAGESPCITLKLLAVNHRSPEIPMPFRNGEVVPIGDVVLTSWPDSRKGAVRVRVLAEQGRPFGGAFVLLSRSTRADASAVPLSLVREESGQSVWASPRVGPGEYVLTVHPNDEWLATGEKVPIVSGKTTEVDLPVYRQREVTLRWWCRQGDAMKWRTGVHRMITGKEVVGEKWLESKAWEDNCGNYLGNISQWDGERCELLPVNYCAVRLKDFKDIETVQFPAKDIFGTVTKTTVSWNSLPALGAIGVGDVFALRDAYLRSDLQVVLRVEQIAPVSAAPGYLTQAELEKSPDKSLPFYRRIHEVSWSGTRFKPAYRGLMGVEEHLLGLAPKVHPDAVASHPDGRIGLSYELSYRRHNTYQNARYLLFWENGALRESVVDIKPDRSADPQSIEERRAAGYFRRFGGPVTFDGSGTCYFGLNGSPPDGLYTVLGRSPVSIKKLCNRGAGYAIQVPAFDPGHLYVTNWSANICRYPIRPSREAASSDTEDSRKPDEWLKVTGERITFSHALVLSPERLLAQVEFFSEGLELMLLEKKRYTRTILLDKAARTLHVLPWKSTGTMTVSVDGQRMVRFDNESKTLREFRLVPISNTSRTEKKAATGDAQPPAPTDDE
jgi:serine/threonine protein kinase